MSEELYPLAVLVDELRHEDVSVRVKAMSNVSTIGLALGEARTRDELVPFLQEVAQEDEDEILVVLADELAKFVPLVGGPAHAAVLVPVLDSLAACEEPTVRDAAVHTLTVVGEALDGEQVRTTFEPLVRRLATADWFSSRMSAAGLFATVLRRVPDAKLLTLFANLVTDDAPMVRRAAATHLPKVIDALPAAGTAAAAAAEEGGAAATEQPLDEMVATLAADDQDSVRLLSIDVVIALMRRAGAPATPAPAPLVKRALDLLTDKSWRVRYMAADRFEQLATALLGPAASGADADAADKEDIQDKLVVQFVRLTKDAEAEVRTAVAKRVVGFSGLLPSDVVLSEIVPALERLTEDISEHVREALATQISHLSGMLGREKTIEFLLPLFLQMLRDEHSEVRLQIISNLQVINGVIGIDLLSQSLLPAISELAKDKQWRVLLAIIEYSPLLAEQLGMEFFNKELVPMVLQWLWDPVWAIRDAAAANLVRLADVFGTPWLEEQIVPKIVGVNPQANYLYRLTSLLAVKTLIPALSLSALTDQVLPFIQTLADDPVPNIRFNCAKAFQVLAAELVAKGANTADARPTVAKRILPALEKHADDADPDVRFFVSRALEEIAAL